MSDSWERVPPRLAATPARASSSSASLSEPRSSTTTKTKKSPLQSATPTPFGPPRRRRTAGLLLPLLLVAVCGLCGLCGLVWVPFAGQAAAPASRQLRHSSGAGATATGAAALAAAPSSSSFSSPGSRREGQLQSASSNSNTPTASSYEEEAIAELSPSSPTLPGRPGARLFAGGSYDLENTEASLSTTLLATAAGAAAVARSASQKDAPKTWDSQALSVLKLPIFVSLWYFFNVQYNLQNKMLLKVFDATWAVSFMQLCSGIPISLLMWQTGLVRKPRITTKELLKLAPVGAAFAAGQVMTVASLGAVAVSFTHVVKALEPAINAIASALVLGQVFHPMVYLSLAPVFAGVALASTSELSFTTFGFLTAMASNFAFVTRNVLAAKLGGVGDMGEDQTERKTNQLAVLTAVAACVVFPIALLMPGGLLSFPSAWQRALATGMPAAKLMKMMATSSFYFFMYQLSSFWVLSQVPPITHSVLNTLKRVVIIVVSIMVFRTPTSMKNAVGTMLAVSGVLLYSLTKKYYSKKEAK